MKDEGNGESYNLEPNKLLISEHTLKLNEVGTIYHKVLERVDFKKDYNEETIKTLLDGFNDEERSVVSIPKIAQAIETIKRFVSVDDEILKEQPFIFKARHCDITNSNCTEEVLVQGVIDLIIKKANGDVIIVDYKNTNIVDVGVLKQKYEKQLYLYKFATELVTKSTNISTYLYSIKNGNIIPVLNSCE